MLAAPEKTKQSRSPLSASAILSLLLVLLTLSGGGFCTPSALVRQRQHHNALHRRILRSVPAERYQVAHRSYHGETWTVRLKDDRVLQGIPCRKGTIELSGRVVLATLSRPHQVGSTLLQEGTIVRWCWRGIRGKARAYLCELALPDDQVIAGVPCRARTDRGAASVVRLHPTGRVAEAILSRDATFSGTACKAGARVYFDDGGQLVNKRK